MARLSLIGGFAIGGLIAYGMYKLTDKFIYTENL